MVDRCRSTNGELSGLHSDLQILGHCKHVVVEGLRPVQGLCFGRSCPVGRVEVKQTPIADGSGTNKGPSNYCKIPAACGTPVVIRRCLLCPSCNCLSTYMAKVDSVVGLARCCIGTTDSESPSQWGSQPTATRPSQEIEAVASAIFEDTTAVARAERRVVGTRA